MPKERCPLHPEALGELARGVIVSVFLFSAVSKLRSLEDFRRTFISLGVSAAPVLWALPRMVVAAEIGCVLALLAGATRAGFIAAALLLTSFTAVFALVAVRGADVRCNCFGSSPTRVGWPDVIRNLLLVAVAITGALVSSSAPGLHFEAAMLPGLATGVALAIAITSVRHVQTALRSDL
jgi:hypothetical protein